MATLIENLNRKISGTNGVLLSDKKTWVDDAQAANWWAGTTGLDTVDALNQKASAGRSPADYKDLQGVANELAGTTGLGVEGASDLW